MKYDETSMWDDPAESSRLRNLLRAGRNAASDYDLERGLARHMATIQAVAPAPGWTTGVHGGAKLASWWLVPFIGASAFVGVWLTTRTVPTHEPVVATVAADANSGDHVATDTNSDTTGNVPGVTVGPNATALTPRIAQTRAVHGERSATRATTVTTVTNTPKVTLHTSSLKRATAAADARATIRPSSADAHGIASRPVSVEAPRATESSPQVALAIAPTPAAEPVAPAPAQRSFAAAAPVQRLSEAAQVQPPAASDSRLEREMQMLAVSQRVLADDPARALHLARQGEREFAGSMLSAERKQVGLLALVQLGRVDEARRLGKPFLSAYPNAPWSERLRRALATGRLPAP